MMEFVNGVGTIPYMKWKIKAIFETTNQQTCCIVMLVYQRVLTYWCLVGNEGMIPVITSNNNPSNPQQPPATHPFPTKLITGISGHNCTTGMMILLVPVSAIPRPDQALLHGRQCCCRLIHHLQNGAVGFGGWVHCLLVLYI